MRFNRLAALTMAGVLAAASLTACGGGSTGSTTAAGTTESAAAADSAADTTAAQADAGTEPAAGDVVTIQVGYENATSEPAAKAVEKWKELVESKSNGTIKMELFPNSALGKKTELIDQMILGEPMITVADGAFLADYGVPDFGISMRRSCLIPGMRSGQPLTATGTGDCAMSWHRKLPSAFCHPTGYMEPEIFFP